MKTCATCSNCTYQRDNEFFCAISCYWITSDYIETADAPCPYHSASSHNSVKEEEK